MLWHRIVIAAVVLGIAAVMAKVVDVRLARRPLAPQAATRYRVLRRSVMTGIIFVGLLSALLTIPQIRAVAGGILASSAVVGLVIGLASQRTLGNFVAGLLIAFAQPLRLGDRVQVEGSWGIVEEIGISYTFIRCEDGSRLVIPNEKLASDTIRNSTIRSPEKVAQISLQVPLGQDLGRVMDLLEHELQTEVFVSELAGQATVTVRARAASELEAERLERELRLRAASVLRTAGIFA